MALPIQPTNTQAGCNPVSSNCVIWQGPDIPCIDLCQGDSISDVTFKVATELCDLVKQLDIQFFDVSCFPPICPKPENIHDLIQFILDTLCTANGSSTAKAIDCADILACQVTIAPCFQKPNSFGDLITQMSLVDYATAIANKVCEILDTITVIQADILSLDARIQVFEDCDACNPVIPAITIPTSCLSPSTNIPITTFVETVETQLCQLKTAVVGNGVVAQTIVSDVLAQQCQGIESAAPLSQPYGSMGLIPGWVTAASGDFTTLSAAVQNLWITVCDMRTALNNVITNCCDGGCSQIVLSLANSSYNAASTTLTVDFAGYIPSSLTSLGPVYLRITDCNGIYFNYNTGSDIFGLIGTSITINFSVVAPGTFNTGCVGANAYSIYINTLNVAVSANQKCDVSITQVVAGGAVPALTITPVSSTVLRSSFTPTYVGPVTYYLELWNNTYTGIVSSVVINTPATGTPYLHSFTGLTTGTTYQTRMTMIAGSSNETGPFYPGTTL